MDKQTPSGIQTWIHFLEEGPGQLWMRRCLTFLCLTGVAVVYLLLEARNFSAPEAMDQAQLARNIADGRGYTTLNIRPLAIHLMAQADQLRGGTGRLLLFKPQPDLANPPVYPYLLAGVFRALPPQVRHGVAPPPLGIHRSPPEVATTGLSVVLFAVAMLLLWRCGTRWFDAPVAALACFCFFGSSAVWMHVTSGLPTALNWVWVLLLAAGLMRFERLVRTAPERTGAALWCAAGCGLVCGLAGLTQYSLGTLAIPSAAFLLAVGRGRHRWLAGGIALAVFAAVLAPWVARNWQISHTPFGLAGYSLIANTGSFPEARLERSLTPAIDGHAWRSIPLKTFNNTLDILQAGAPRLGGSWLAAFFLASLLVRFQDQARKRLRWLTVGIGATLILAQAAAQTDSTRIAPHANAEDLLMVLAPLAFLFGAAVVETLLEARSYPFPLLKSLARTGMLLVLCLPMAAMVAQDMTSLIGLTSRRTFPMVDPPYRPDVIEKLCGGTAANAVLMSDVPWAVAWYGERTAIWATLRVQDDFKEDFFAVHAYQHPIWAVYISPLWVNAPLRDKFVDDPDFAWGRFYLDAFLRRNLPQGFPLTHIYGDNFMSFGHFFVAVQDTWSASQR